MHPIFRKFLPKRGDATTQFNCRITPEMHELLRKVAEVDGDSNGISGLVFEGITRVLLDRGQDPNFREKLTTHNQAYFDSLDDEVAFIESLTPLKPTTLEF